MPAEALTTLVFWLLATISLGLAWTVVTGRRILRAAVSLMGVLGASAGLYLLLGAPFMAGVQVLVYVGGIVVLLVFAVMLTRTTELLEEQPALHRRLIGGVVALGFFGVAWHALGTASFPVRHPGPAPLSDVAALGRALLGTGADGYVLPFELISMLLLSAMIGGIVIARKPTADPHDLHAPVANPEVPRG